MSIQTTNNQYNGFVDAFNYQQQQGGYQLPPQMISDRLRLLTQRASQQQSPYHQPIMTISQYQQMPEQQPSSPEHEFMETNQLANKKNKAAKRAEHNAIERARREHLNIKFQQLAHSLPNLQNDRRPSKGTIIERTLEFVKQTVQKEEKYKNEIRELSKANRQLMLQVANKNLMNHKEYQSYPGSIQEEEEENEQDLEYDFMDDFDVDDELLENHLSRKSSCSSIEAQSMTSAPTIGSTSSVSLTTSPSVDGYLPTQQHAHPSWDYQTLMNHNNNNNNTPNDLYYRQHQQLMMMDPSLLKTHPSLNPTTYSDIKFESAYMS
ncbi:unnamed protein product [Cunninghamella blakesleeana]